MDHRFTLLSLIFTLSVTNVTSANADTNQVTFTQESTDEGN
ncbi:MAG: hypothetical protein Q4P06_06575 [Actinomycetaceae bacterium]|nr:hypothetical protein [Actinomycetaceae bacterium]